MAYIPDDARWYLADVVLEHTVEGDPRNVVHINVHLIEADSPERAHEKAVALGQGSEHVYRNTDGREVRVTFRGLRDLNAAQENYEQFAAAVLAPRRPTVISDSVTLRLSIASLLVAIVCWALWDISRCCG